MRAQGLLSPIGMLCLCVIAFASEGCHKSDPNSGLQIEPSKIEIGVIASTGQEVDFTFKLVNSGSKELPVTLRTSCGCIVSDDQGFVLSPGESREVSLSLSSYGRSGDFYGEVLVESSAISKTVPIKAVFLPKVHSFPSRIVLLSSEGESLAGEIRIEAPKDLWPTLEVIANEAEVKCMEIESSSETRKYRIVSIDLQRSYSPIVLKLRGQETPVLTIPVIRGTL